VRAHAGSLLFLGGSAIGTHLHRRFFVRWHHPLSVRRRDVPPHTTRAAYEPTTPSPDAMPCQPCPDRRGGPCHVARRRAAGAVILGVAHEFERTAALREKLP